MPDVVTREWRPIETAAKERWPRVDLWMAWGASPLTMGMGDHFRVADCWFEGGKWFHSHDGKEKELNADYITHWMPRPLGPDGEEWD